MVSKEEYLEYIKNSVVTDSKDLKYFRKSYNTISSIMLILGVGCFAIVKFSESFYEKSYIFSILGAIFLIPSLFRFAKSMIARKKLEEKYRQNILDYLLKGVDYTYDPNDSIDENIFINSQFERYYDRYYGNDKLSINIPNDDGTKSNNYLVLSDIVTYDVKKDSDGSERKKDRYVGTFGYIEFSHSFKCTLCINTSYKKSGLKLEKVELESMEFNEEFSIRSNDQVEARYILTPDMMLKILELKKLLKKLLITFVDNKLYIGFPDRDILELKLLKGSDEPYKLFEDFYEDIKIILDIVNEIKDNNKIFKI